MKINNINLNHKKIENKNHYFYYFDIILIIYNILN